MQPDLAVTAIALSPRDPSIIRHYHAHVYYDPTSTRAKAASLRDAVAAAFPEATLGRWHDELVGPHLQSMYQIAFPCALFGSFLPWLMLNHAGLTVLVHPGTGNPFADHTEHAIWLGGTLPLRAEVLEGAPSAAEPQAQAEESIERGNDG